MSGNLTVFVPIGMRPLTGGLRTVSASGATMPPWASARSWQPRQTPSTGMPPATASHSNAFSVPSQG